MRIFGELKRSLAQKSEKLEKRSARRDTDMGDIYPNKISPPFTVQRQSKNRFLLLKDLKMKAILLFFYLYILMIFLDNSILPPVKIDLKPRNLTKISQI